MPLYSSVGTSEESKIAVNSTTEFASHPRPSLTSNWLRILYSSLLPLIAVTYLAFCYTVHFRTISLSGKYGQSENLSRVKAGVTSISIIIFSIALWPLQSLLNDLRSEEFFRALSSHRNGVPLASINAISSASSDFFTTAATIRKRHSSGYFIVAFVSGFLVIATSTLAPAALTVQTIALESDIVALAVGAITPETVINGTQTTSSFSSLLELPAPMQNNVDQAASLAWAEVAMNIPYSFIPPIGTPSQASYIVPFPNISTTTSARWLSDVISIQPICEWARTNITEQRFTKKWVNATFEDNLLQVAMVNFPDHEVDLNVKLSSLFLASELIGSSIVEFMGPTPKSSASAQLTNSTNGNIISTGITVWAVGRCSSTCEPRYLNRSAYVDFDLTTTPKTSFVFPDRTFDIAFLVCSPNAQIVSGEIQANGTAALQVTVLNEDKQYTQRNLHPAQSTLLLTMALSDFTASSGPAFNKVGYGTDLQMQFLFGKEASSKVSRAGTGLTMLTPEPVANITAKYGRILQSSTKPFMTPGVLGTMYVPARVFQDQVVFQVSLPHVVVSTILLLFLSLVVMIAHFRPGKGETFTLFSVASSLQGSSISERFAQHERELNLPENELVAMWGVRMVSMHQGVNGTQRQLHLE